MSTMCVTSGWTEKMIRRVAGIFILVSVLLAWQVDLRWLFFTAFVGANLLQFSFTNFCPLALVLRRFDPEAKASGAGPSVGTSSPR